MLPVVKLSYLHPCLICNCILTLLNKKQLRIHCSNDKAVAENF